MVWWGGGQECTFGKGDLGSNCFLAARCGVSGAPPPKLGVCVCGLGIARTDEQIKEDHVCEYLSHRRHRKTPVSLSNSIFLPGSRLCPGMCCTTHLRNSYEATGLWGSTFPQRSVNYWNSTDKKPGRRKAKCRRGSFSLFCIIKKLEAESLLAHVSI